MSACTQCGTPARPTDKFCNACGTPIAPASPAGPAYGTPPPYAPRVPALQMPAGFGGAMGAASPPRCQLGHEIAPGSSYCAQGHPIALDQMQFSNDAYPGAGSYAGTPPPSFAGTPPPVYVAPPPLPPLPPMPPFGPPQQPPAFGQSPLPPAYGQPQQPPPFGQPQQVPQPPPFGGPGLAATAYAQMETAREAPPKALRGFLVAFGTNPNGDFWPLTGGRLVVGRLGAAERTDIGLQDPTISSRHAAMVVDAASGTITIEDTGSTNGTFVNDEHIGFNGKRELRDGDRVRFGAYTSIVKLLGRV